MANVREDVIMNDTPDSTEKQNQKQPEQSEANLSAGYPKASVINTKTISAPPFSYVCLELISDTAIRIKLDEITVRAHITSALTQFLGLAGSSISVDILKVDGKHCWVRVPREDLSPVIAAVGGWTRQDETEGSVGWKVKASGNWLSTLIAEREAERLWEM